MADILTSVTTFIDAAFDWLDNVVTAITGNPVLMIFVVCVPLVGLAIGLFNRLIRSN